MERVLATFATDQFQWREIDTDDFVCEIGHYTLRVEHMGYFWWWGIYYKGSAFLIGDTTTNSKYRAIGLCEGVYLGHSAKYKHQ